MGVKHCQKKEAIAHFERLIIEEKNPPQYQSDSDILKKM